MQDVVSAGSDLSARFGADVGGLVGPISGVVGAGYALLGALWNVKEVCMKKRNNDDIVGELSTFITNLNLDLALLKQRTPRSNSAMWAAGALKHDLDRATEYVRECLHRGYIKSIWSVSTISNKLKRIREELVTSFQTKLQIIIFDVVIEEQSKQEEFRANLSRVQGALTDALADSAVVWKEWKDEVQHVNANILDLRAELKALLQPVLDGVAAGKDRNMDLNTAIALTRRTEPQTSESEKFLADVVANLEGRKDRSQEQGPHSAQDDAEDRWFEDPITAEVMCDPVKCSDGRTYDRWTVIDKHMVESPFDKSLPEFGIVVDDITVRTRLFRMFPEQEAVFHARRVRHREEALQHASEEECGDALQKLDQVLQWTRPDQEQECRSKRKQVHQLLQRLEGTLPERSNTGPYKLTAVLAMADPEQPLLLPAALVGLPDIDSLDSHSSQRLALLAKLESHSPTFLGVQYVGLSAEGLGHIAGALPRGRYGRLSRLGLCGNDIGNAVGAQHLAHILTNSPKLRSLAISNIGMDEEGAVLIAEALAHTTTLTGLSIGDLVPRNPKQPAPIFIIPLLQALMWPDDFPWGPINIKKENSRKTLKKQWDEAGGQEAVEPGLGHALARLLRSNRVLNELTLASFFVTRGLGALRENRGITKLWVFHSQHSDDDDMDPMLIAILHECKTVQELGLEFRKPFGPSRFTKAFFQGLRDNRSIKKLVLDGWDGLDVDMFHDLMGSLGPNSNNVLEDISIKDTSWESQGKGKHIQNALVQNRRSRRNAGRQGRDTAS